MKESTEHLQYVIKKVVDHIHTLKDITCNVHWYE